MNDPNSPSPIPGPLAPIPAAGQTRSAIFYRFGDLVEKLGGNPRRILERNGIDRDALANRDTLVSCKSMVEAFEDCSRSLDDPLFGLHLAEMQAADLFGSLSTLLRSAPDLETALRALCDYVDVAHTPEFGIDLHREGEIAELRWSAHRTDYGAYDQVNHHSLMRFIQLLRELGEGSFQPRHAGISTSISPGLRAEVEGKIGCAIALGRPVNHIGFSKDLLARPLRTSDPLVFALLRDYFDRIKSSSRRSIRERVEAYVNGAVLGRSCSLAGCAAKLGISARTIQNRLRQDGESFSAILDAKRLELAQAYLTQGKPIGEIAAMLGYTEQTSFGRAFKRWTGAMPSSARRRRDA